MVHVEQLTNYNYALNFRGIGPRLYNFDTDDVDADVKRDLTTLMGEYVTKIECLVNYEDIEDERYPEQLTLLNLSIYVVFNLDSHNKIEELLLMLGDYLSRAFIRDISNHE